MLGQVALVPTPDNTNLLIAASILIGCATIAVLIFRSAKRHGKRRKRK